MPSTSGARGNDEVLPVSTAGKQQDGTTEVQPELHSARSALDQPRRALLVVNRVARHAADEYAIAATALRHAGIAVTVLDEPDKLAVASSIVRQQDACDAVIVAGGDGSLNVALQALVHVKKPLGIVPVGTANDLARSVGVPLDVKGACDVIAAGITRPIDVGRVNDVYFFNEMSIGLSPTVTRLLTKEDKAKLGTLALLVRGARVVHRLRRFRVEIECDGRRSTFHSPQLTIGNSSSFGGLIRSDEAALDDHRLDLYSISFPTWWSFFEGLLALIRRRYDDARSVKTMHGKLFTVRTRRRRPIEADGEIVSATPAVVRVVPSAVRVFVPASHAT